MKDQSMDMDESTRRLAAAFASDLALAVGHIGERHRIPPEDRIAFAAAVLVSMRSREVGAAGFPSELGLVAEEFLGEAELELGAVRH
jgi:hypothetical protein